MLEPLRNDWKEEIRPILELYVDRTPGSFIEEKEFSLVWHYRKADPELAQLRARELRDALLHITGAYSIKVGLSPSKARFNIGSLYEVRSLLKTLGEKEISHEQ